MVGKWIYSSLEMLQLAIIKNHDQLKKKKQLKEKYNDRIQLAEEDIKTPLCTYMFYTLRDVKVNEHKC